MDAQQLAAKFSAKTAATVVERDKQTAIAAENNAKRLDDVEHCKRQLADAVIPFLEELQTHLPKEQFSFAWQIDQQDHKPVGVSFRIGDGSPITIATAFGNVIVTRSGNSGSSKGVRFVYPPDSEPWISNSGDLTSEKVAKLIEMEIDND